MSDSRRGDACCWGSYAGPGAKRWRIWFDNDWRHDVRYHGYLEQPMANVIRENVRRLREVVARYKSAAQRINAAMAGR